MKVSQFLQTSVDFRFLQISSISSMSTSFGTSDLRHQITLYAIFFKSVSCLFKCFFNGITYLSRNHYALGRAQLKSLPKSEHVFGADFFLKKIAFPTISYHERLLFTWDFGFLFFVRGARCAHSSECVHDAHMFRTCGPNSRTCADPTMC